MITIACVYKSGGSYSADYVRALKAGLDLNETQYHRFVCLTDKPDEVRSFAEPIILKYDLPGWWSKIELFEPDKFSADEVVIYFDLDTIVMKPIHYLVNVAQIHKGVKMLRGQSAPSKKHDFPASGIMSWRGNEMSEVYTEFFNIGAAEVIRRQENQPYGGGQQGDQGFIRRYIDPIRWQDILPDNYFWYKRNYKATNKTIPNAIHILVWSGEPRLHKAYKNVKEIWKDYVRRSKKI